MLPRLLRSILCLLVLLQISVPPVALAASAQVRAPVVLAEEPFGNSRSATSSHDTVGNPTAMTGSTASRAYGYDAVGNRTGLTVNGVQTTSTFDAADRLTRISRSTTASYVRMQATMGSAR